MHLHKTLQLTHQRRRSSGRLLAIFGPVLAVGTLGALVAIAAANAGWHTGLMHRVAIGLGITLVVLAVALFTSKPASAERST